MSDYKTYMSLSDTETANEITSIFSKNNIPYKIEDTSKNFDASFSLSNTGKSIMIFLDPKNFIKANEILDRELILDVSKINEEHFLYGFTNEELLDVIKNAEEWHPLDVKLSKEILKERNFNLTEKTLANLKEIKNQELKKPEKNDITWIIFGYAFAILGGFIGFFIAYHLMTYKKTLPNGESIYSYSEIDRNHGKKMLYIASISVIITTIVIFKR